VSEARTRQVRIPKRRGEYRTIYVPSAEYKYELSHAAGKLERKARSLDKNEVSHGFTRHKSPITNALAHVNHAFTLSIDLKDFFDHVTPEKVKGKLAKAELDLVIENGAARQGLPTSPAVANIAFSDSDSAILKWIAKNKKNVVYTRYADDLTFSFDDEGLEKELLPALKNIIGRAGFKINERKIALQCARDGRRKITGVAVDAVGVHPTRDSKRKLRAARHQKNIDEARGLEEWCKCKLPAGPRKIGGKDEKLALSDLEALTKGWRLKKVNADDIPFRETEQLTEQVVVSADPAMYLGMSTFTNGWTSCMNQKNGQYRKTVVSWLMLKGTRVAYLFKEKDTVTFHGVERHKMHARCLVHTLRSGDVVYDRLYGNEIEKQELRLALEAWGAISVDALKTQGDRRVVGSTPKKLGLPYCDSLKTKPVKRNGQAVNVLYVPAG
jgi:hypothetical protein